MSVIRREDCGTPQLNTQNGKNAMRHSLSHGYRQAEITSRMTVQIKRAASSPSKETSKMNNLLGQVSYPVFLYMTFLFCLIASAFSFVVGIALLSRSRRALRFFDLMNRWVSVRKMMKPLSTPHFIEPVLMKRRNILGSGIIVGALATILLLAQADLATALSLFNGSLSQPQITGVAENLKEFLLVGNAICVLVGAMIIFSPDFLATVESYTDRWYTMRKRMEPLDRMHMEVDCWVLKHPTSVGLALCILSLSAGLLIFDQLQKL